MKYLLPVLACALLVSCTSTHKKKEKNDLERLHYNGKVKSVAYKIYRAKGDSGTKGEKEMVVSKVITMCNNNGYFVGQDNFKNGERLNYRVMRKYDTNNNLVTETRMETVVVNLSQGDMKGDSMKMEKDTFAYKFDNNGNKIEMKVSRNKKPSYRDVNTFDANGNITYQEEYVPWDTLYKKESYKYDKDGNVIEKISRHPDTSKYVSYSYKYDAKGNMIECFSKESKSDRSSTETIKYDDKGNIIEDVNKDNTGYVFWNWRYEFSEFDKNGNWTKETSYSNNKPQAITERQIDYY